MQLTPMLRPFQLTFAAIVLGISVELARGQETDIESAPAVTGHAAVCGALGLLIAVVGIISLPHTLLSGYILWAADGLSGLTMMLGSGIAYAVIPRNTNFSDKLTTWDNQVLSGGCWERLWRKECWYYSMQEGKLNSRCMAAKADTAFVFLSFVTCLVIVVDAFFLRRKGKDVVDSYYN